MSSSSSPPEVRPPFEALLLEMLDELAESCPAHMAEAARAIGERTVAMRVGDANVTLAVRAERIEPVPPVDGLCPALESDDRTLVALVDGRRELLDAARAGDLILRGSLGQLVTFMEAFQAFLHGCVRAPGAEARLERYRTGVERGAAA